MTALPSRRSLYACWAILMTMTAVSLWAGDPTGDGSRLSLAAITLVLAAAMIKAAQILLVFLNLRSSTGTWKATFFGFLVTIVALVWICAAIGFWLK